MRADYLKVVLQIGALWSRGCAKLGGGGGETEKERDECKECFHGDAIGRRFPKGKRTELVVTLLGRILQRRHLRRQEMKGDGLAASDGKLLRADIRAGLECRVIGVEAPSCISCPS